MNDLPKKVTLYEQLDAYLARACGAEATGNVAEAERLLRLALDCEETPQSGVGNAGECVQQANPLSQQDQAATSAANLPAAR